MMCWSYFGSFPSTIYKDPNIDNDNIAMVHSWTIDDMCEKCSPPLRPMSEKTGILLLITWNNSLVFSSCYVIIPIVLTWGSHKFTIEETMLHRVWKSFFNVR